MSAIQLSKYFYRVFNVVFERCKLYLVAQEVDFKISFFPSLYMQVFACHAIIWLQKSRQFTGVKRFHIVNSNYAVQI